MEEFNQMSPEEAMAAGGFLAGIGLGFFIFIFAISIFMIIARWKVYEKAGQPGWGVLVPIYNIILLFRIAKAPGWWFLMFFIPIANIIFMIKFTHKISKNFGKDGGFTAGLILLPIVFWAILGFGSAQYLNEGSSDQDVLDA